MKSKLKGTLKGSLIYLKTIFLVVFIIVLIPLLGNLILNHFASEVTQVSVGNTLAIIIIIMPVLFPLHFFEKIIEAGADRKKYYQGILITYVLTAVIIAVFNIIVYQIEQSFFNEFGFKNILEFLRWDEVGMSGVFFYQMGVYLFGISLFNFLFSNIYCLKVMVLDGIILFVIMGAVFRLRADVFKFLSIFFFNSNPAAGFLIVLALSVIMLVGGWFLIKKREVK